VAVFDNLDEVMEEVENELEEKDEVRELAMKTCRQIVRLSSDLIYMLHRQKKGKNIIEGYRELRAKVTEVNTLLHGHYEVYYSGFVEDAMQEYVEATLLRSAVTGDAMPSPSQLKVDSSTYILGLADVIGEMRRMALDSMIGGNVREASKWVSEMERLYLALSKMHFPGKVVEIKRKQDVARSLLDRTRGELAVTVASYTRKK
jgi:translin